MNMRENYKERLGKLCKEYNYFDKDFEKDKKAFEDMTKKVMRKFGVSDMKAKDLVSKSTEYNPKDEQDIMRIIQKHLLPKEKLESLAGYFKEFSVGDRVVTPDGAGEIVDISGSKIVVDLDKSGKMADQEFDKRYVRYESIKSQGYDKRTIDDVKKQLDREVKAGKLSQKEADDYLENFSEGTFRSINSTSQIVEALYDRNIAGIKFDRIKAIAVAKAIEEYFN